ncbi:MAG TPA: AAA family ATPase, partial [Vitreimonas sp.]|nr:AAA family ATPase [Vitreimonas sp.]
MGTVSSPILIGRAAELARLLEAVERAADGRPQLALVTGEAGIGKSRLVAELVASVRMAGSRVLSGGCLDIGAAAVPYLPLAEALRGLARSLSPDELAAVLGPTREDLAAIAPELGSPGIAAPDTTAGSVGQARLFERVLQLVGRLAEDRSLLLVVEDVHWIDRGTRDLLTFLVRNLTGERILAVLTVRTEDLPAGHPNLAWAAELSRAPGSLRVPLQALDRSQTAEQVAAITG